MTLRIGVVGVGFGATVHIPAFQSEGVDVVAVCARRVERAEETAQRYGIERVCKSWEELVALEEIDAVAVATPVPLRLPVVLGALEEGKHVLAEKPFALHAADAEQMWRRASELGRTAMVAHEFRFASARMRARELIEEGYIGTPRLALIELVRAQMGPAPAVADPSRQVPEYRPERDAAASGAGFLFGLGSHYIDCVRDLLGEVSSVSGQLVTFAPERAGASGPLLADADDTFVFTFELARGGLVQMAASRVAPFGATSSLAIYGSDGTLITPQSGVNPPAHGTLLGARLGEAELTSLEIPERLEPFADDRDDRLMPFRLLVRAFVSGIESGTSPAPNFYDGWRCQQVLDAVRESSATGHRVTIPPAI